MTSISATALRKEIHNIIARANEDCVDESALEW